MIGIVIVTHPELGAALLESVKFITNEEAQNVEYVSIDIDKNPDNSANKIRKAIKKVDNQKGVIILTDMFGGTCSNLSYSLLEEGKIEIISGVNLPILFKAISMQKEEDFSKAISTIESFGKRSISVASKILQGEKRN